MHKPILFSTEMVQAILKGRKTQTRRILKPQPKKQELDFPVKLSEFVKSSKSDLKKGYEKLVTSGELKGFLIPNAKHQPGDILWVRETYRELVNCETNEFACYDYKADMPVEFHLLHPEYKWKPSIYMPKAAARIFLKVTDIRCERLNDIPEEDAIAEGIEFQFYDTDLEKSDPKYKNYMSKYDFNTSSPVHSFASLWRKINGPDSWEQNPWVWVYTFEKINKPSNWNS